MSVAIRNKKPTGLPDRKGKTENFARKLGGRRFDINEVVDTPEISDEELEEFLKLRRELRKTELEAEKDCLP
jgi:hypothetical protein